jgi:hypothetical protein
MRTALGPKITGKVRTESTPGWGLECVDQTGVFRKSVASKNSEKVASEAALTKRDGDPGTINRCHVPRVARDQLQ